MYSFQVFTPLALEEISLVPFRANKLIIANLSTEDSANAKIHVMIYGFDGKQGDVFFFDKNLFYFPSLKKYLTVTDLQIFIMVTNPVKYQITKSA